MKHSIKERLEILEKAVSQVMPDQVRITMKDGTKRDVFYYEPVYDGITDDITEVELLQGIGEGAEILKLLIGGKE